MSKKIQTYTTEELTVTFDPNVCIHAAKCVGGLPKVFNINEKPWVQPGNATKEAVMATIEQCPSKALSYTIKGQEIMNESSTSKATELSMFQDGPIQCEGDFVIKDANGNVLETKTKVFLCRCGHSTNKPFCDGKHKAEGFKG